MVEFLDAKFFNRIKGVSLNSINGPLDKNLQRPHKESETQAITRKDETTSSFLLSAPSKNDLKKQTEKPSGQYI